MAHKGYFPPKLEIEITMLSIQNFFDEPVKNDIKLYEKYDLSRR